MTPTTRSNTISSAYAEFFDTGERVQLTTKPGSHCHFFEPFTADDLEVRLRLDWGDPDTHGHPTLDADFRDHATGKPKKSSTRARSEAHHTQASKERTYEWVFKEHCRAFRVVIHWIAKAEESLTMGDSVLGEVCKGKGW